MNKHVNDLIHESSPYLLQHAHNPVNWHAWKDEVLDFARKENRLLLISVGYSACHWCHVMEHESFEDEDIAELMNANYICIKVDREERPDIDHVYMNAVQAMTGMGGWPMNVVALPDGRPVWGGTYFKKDQWRDALTQISKLFEKKPEQLLEYANKLEAGLKQLQIIDPPEKDSSLDPAFFTPLLEKWKRSMDHKHGGLKRAPKFMMPSNYEFLLRYAYHTSDKQLEDYCLHTLNKMSWGGVFDPVDGGFSRYSVDERWHVPHFEKMLYDNAQLISLYSQAYRRTKNEWYRQVAELSLEFIQNELTDATGAFYSALDADSPNKNGVQTEGAYYTWTIEELRKILKEDFDLFQIFYNINSYGKWEKDTYVLFRTKSHEEIADEFELSSEELEKKKTHWQKLLKQAKKDREKPGLDDKSLTSWNAMTISAYVEAYKSFGNEEYLHAALRNARFITKYQLTSDGKLFHNYKDGKSSINGYLEDYAFTIQAFIDLYQAAFDKEFLELAIQLTEYVQKHFVDKDSGLFSFTSTKDRPLITKTIESTDNVIPASNSVMARNLFKIGKLTGHQASIEQAKKMLLTVMPRMAEYPQGYSNWLNLLLDFTYPFFEVAVTGEKSKKNASSLNLEYLPNMVIAAAESEDESFLLQNRFKEGTDLFYVCQEGNCQLPLYSKSDVIASLREV